MTKKLTLLGAIACAVALSACGGGSSPAKLADETTRAIYATDRDAAVRDFDDALKDQVTRAQVGAMSDAMHMLGTYHGLKQVQGNADTGRYDFTADFDKGTMIVMVRVDPSGKLGAYRITPTEPQAQLQPK